jgi:phosphoglycerate dehydrogenase-like enzyme
VTIANNVLKRDLVRIGDLTRVKRRARSTLLIAVADPWFEQFVGEDDARSLGVSFKRVERADPADLSSSHWPRLIQRLKPAAIMTGWGSPGIPLTAWPGTRYVAHLAGEVRGIVGRELIEQGLWVTNWGASAAAPVAEAALTLILCSLRRMTQWSLLMHRDRAWSARGLMPGISLFGKRVGIHGFGNVARELVRLLQPFQCVVSAYSKGVPQEVFRENGVAMAASLDDLFAESDVLVEAEAFTSRTRGIITERLLRLLPIGASFVNIGRGPLVDEMAICRIAAEGRIHFALDVFGQEPLPENSPLRGMMNVTLTPHVAGPTVDHRRTCGRVTVENLRRFARGELPDGLISLEIYDRST